MKPRNFPGRKLARRAGANHRLIGNYSAAHHHEKFVLQGLVPNDYRFQPKDIRVRSGKSRRDLHGRAREVLNKHSGPKT